MAETQSLKDIPIQRKTETYTLRAYVIPSILGVQLCASRVDNITGTDGVVIYPPERSPYFAQLTDKDDFTLPRKSYDGKLLSLVTSTVLSRVAHTDTYWITEDIKYTR